MSNIRELFRQRSQEEIEKQARDKKAELEEKARREEEERRIQNKEAAERRAWEERRRVRARLIENKMKEYGVEKEIRDLAQDLPRSKVSVDLSHGEVSVKFNIRNEKIGVEGWKFHSWDTFSAEIDISEDDQFQGIRVSGRDSVIINTVEDLKRALVESALHPKYQDDYPSSLRNKPVGYTPSNERSGP